MVHCNWNAKSLAVKREGGGVHRLRWKLGRKGGSSRVVAEAERNTYLFRLVSSVPSVPYRKTLKVASEGRKEGRKEDVVVVRMVY